MAISTEGIANAEAWKPGSLLPVGHHKVKVQSAEESKSSGGHDQIEFEFGNDQGSIRDWMVFTPATAGKVKQFVEAVGLDLSGLDAFPTDACIGKALVINIIEEPDYKDPSKTRKRVSDYLDKSTKIDSAKPDTSDFGPKSDDIPF